MQFLIKCLDRLAPNLAAKLIYNRISNPQVRKLRPFEERVLAESDQQIIKFRDFEIQGYTWGQEGNPIALLVHGWEGQAGNFGAMVSQLLDYGYQVTAYDGPAHGKSSRKATNMFEYSDFIAERIQIHQPQLMISHSFGTVTTMRGLIGYPEFRLKQWIIVAPPFSFAEYLDTVKQRVQIPDRTMAKLVQMIEKDSNAPLEDMNMITLGALLNPIDSCTIVHSDNDKVIPFRDAERTAEQIKDSELIKLHNLGHYKILWSEPLKEVLANKLLTPQKQN